MTESPSVAQKLTEKMRFSENSSYVTYRGSWTTRTHVPAKRRTRKYQTHDSYPVFEVDIQVVPVTGRTNDTSYPKLVPYFKYLLIF